jgi:hypothetical protein
MAPPGSHGDIDRGTQDTPRVFSFFVYEIFTLYDWSFHIIPLKDQIPHRSPTTPPHILANVAWFGLLPFRSPLLRQSLWFLFLTLLRCFSSGGSHYSRYFSTEVENFTTEWPSINSAGFPHSDTAGSQDLDSYPTIIVVLHVLLRYVMPRNPLSALISDLNLVQCTRYDQLLSKMYPS